MIVGDDLELFERSLRHATETATGEALDAALDELGWPDALAADRPTAVSVLFELQGRTGATSTALDAVLAGALGIDRASVTVVLPPLGTTGVPGRPAPGGVAVSGLAGDGVHRGDVVAVPMTAGEGTSVALVDPAALTWRDVDGLDPVLGLVAIEEQIVAADVFPAGPPEAWADAVAVGQLAVAHELVGASRAMLQLARDHAMERIQFDQPIARFQAVRHRLAEALVAIEAADATAAGAWADGSAFAAAAAKAVAGRSARVVARHCQQVLAGIGFTTEHPLHLHVRRALVLDRLLGDAKSLTKAMGEELLRSRRLPPMLPL